MHVNSTFAVVDAVYTEQRIQKFRGNPLIEALPPALDELELFDYLATGPDFSTEQRDWPTHERMQLVAGLSSFMVPLPRHIELARTLDVILREGYVGRQPRTAAHNSVFQKIYEAQKAGTVFSEKRSAAAPQLSTSLVGISGMGKTTTVERVLARTPDVIFHPELDIWQIPYLHIETPYDGVSVKGLAHSILRKVDSLIPDANYYEMYALRGKPGTTTLMNNVARVMHIHCVGLLVVDEIQNIENARKDNQSLMTLLVSASNELRVPIMFIGTNKARRILGLDFRQARRSAGQGCAYWNRLSVGSESELGEWDDFIQALWEYQWLKQPVQLNCHLSAVMYHYSQGIIDIAIKLFAAAQWRAMLDGSETITEQLIESVAQKELSMVAPMVEALRNNDLAQLERYDDIAPFGFEALMQDAKTRYTGLRLRGASLAPGHEKFAPTVATALANVGVPEPMAIELATRVEASGGVSNALDGTAKALSMLKPPKRTRRKHEPNAPPPGLALEDGDLRRASIAAKAEGTTTFEQLARRGQIYQLEELLVA